MSMFSWSSIALCGFNSGLYKIALRILQDDSVPSATHETCLNCLKLSLQAKTLKNCHTQHVLLLVS